MTTLESAHGPEGGPVGMSRRQLLRHTAWFGAAVVLTVTSGEVISHLGTPPAPRPPSRKTRTRCGSSRSATAT